MLLGQMTTEKVDIKKYIILYHNYDIAIINTLLLIIDTHVYVMYIIFILGMGLVILAKLFPKICSAENFGSKYKRLLRPGGIYYINHPRVVETILTIVGAR